MFCPKKGLFCLPITTQCACGEIATKMDRASEMNSLNDEFGIQYFGTFIVSARAI